MWPSLDGRTELVKSLLDKGADINTKTNEGWTALMQASRQGHAEVVKLLLDRGADVNATFDGRTALTFASVGGHSDVVNLLKAHGARSECETKKKPYSRPRLSRTFAILIGYSCMVNSSKLPPSKPNKDSTSLITICNRRDLLLYFLHQFS